GAGPGFLAGDQPNRTKPNLQGQMSRLKDRARSHCALTATILTGPAMTPIQPTHFPLTGRTDEAGGPAQLGQILTAGVFRSEPLLHFEQGSRIIFVHARILSVVVVVGKWIALWPEFDAAILFGPQNVAAIRHGA